ncbi:hypothetical protein F7R91_32715 [Streptomyces luteolifulvus]|uniref:Uncharacterized protein n=1 Tax=Streptomyces luteolifulvus TaxID=2615112 RepID=A0A6H9USH3_9ACTN|nr:hypothetical protein [Streptomyces luteolifulvus]KAB1141390.1 hypothetical protein F7R91_32715 [Streptomyces luteolifulvus]
MTAQEPAIVTAEQLAKEVTALVRRYERGQEQQRQLADSLELRMSRAVKARKEWKEVEKDLPSLLVEVRDAGWEPKQIATLFDLTESYVYRKLREHGSAQ